MFINCQFMLYTLALLAASRLEMSLACLSIAALLSSTFVVEADLFAKVISRDGYSRIPSLMQLEIQD